MKLYDRNITSRLVTLAVLLLILVFVCLSRLTGIIYIPETADPQTLYQVAWQVTGETFYDQQKLQDWRSWEHKFDGKLHSQEDAVKAINEMLASLGDQHTYFLNPTHAAAENSQRRGSFVGIGIGWGPQVVDGKPVLAKDGQVMPAAGPNGFPLITVVVEGGPAAKAGVKVGDQVVAVNGVTTVGVSMNALSESIRGANLTPVKLTILRGVSTLEVTVTRANIAVKSVTHKRLDNNLGYIRIEHFGADNMLPQLGESLRALRDCRGLIVDLRGNPGGQVQNALWGAAFFLEQGDLVHQKVRQDGRLIESQISLTPKDLVVSSLMGSRSKLLREPRMIRQASRQPLVILVDRGSASASEMFAGALQDNGRAVVVGMGTYGKGVGQAVIDMPNGASIHITNMRYYTPKHRWLGDGSGGLFSMGIIPDVEVAWDKVRGTDNQLKAAQGRLEALITSGR